MQNCRNKYVLNLEITRFQDFLVAFAINSKNYYFLEAFYFLNIFLRI